MGKSLPARYYASAISEKKYRVACCGRQEEPAILISRLLLRMRRMFVASICWTFTKNEWNAQSVIWSRVFCPSVTWKLRKTAALEQERFDLRSKAQYLAHTP